MKSVGGRLKFKGDSAKAPKRKREEVGPGESSAASAPKENEQQPAPEVKIETGAGRITSSGTTVYGHDGSQFMSQLASGDALIIMHPQSCVEEMKVVRMVLSNVSCSISSAFSSDLVSTTAFRYAKAPKSAPDLESEERRKKERADKAEASGVGTYASQGGSVFTYRVKKEGASGGYKIVTESLAGGGVTRGDLLEMRAKKKADRYCM